MLVLKIALGKDFFDALPSAESLCCSVALGANQAWGLGTPRDMGTWDLVHRALSDPGHSGQLFYWCDRSGHGAQRRQRVARILIVCAVGQRAR